MTVTGYHEHVRTEEALETLTRWGPRPPHGRRGNIAFPVSRQGAPSDVFLAIGDCTPFTPLESRDVLSGQAPADAGARE